MKISSILSVSIILCALCLTGMAAHAQPRGPSPVPPPRTLSLPPLAGSDIRHDASFIIPPEGQPSQTMLIPASAFQAAGSTCSMGTSRISVIEPAPGSNAPAFSCQALAPVMLPSGANVQRVEVLVDYGSDSSDACSITAAFWGEDMLQVNQSAFLSNVLTKVARHSATLYSGNDQIKKLVLTGTRIEKDVAYSVLTTINADGFDATKRSRCSVRGVQLHYSEE
jgi:hypothetical protein